jgi:MerR family transcriptional regulator, heat shock protein HspR
MISSVAESYQIHPQTLRLYERLGLLKPSRSEGNTRLYTEDDLQRLEVILTLTRELGVNLAGVEVILTMREKMEKLQEQVEEMIDFVQAQVSPTMAGSMRNALVPVPAAKIVRSQR